VAGRSPPAAIAMTSFPILLAPLVAMALGTEDFSAAVGGAPELDLLLTPNLSVLFPMRQSRLDRKHRRFLDNDNFVGPQAIHLNIDGAFHQAHKNSRDPSCPRGEKDATAQGKGAFTLDGKMVDLPVIRRVREIISMDQGAELAG
jgi:citrate lyase subunit beta/citryl-CoA lyase